MECNFTQKVSQLIDRELSPEDEAATRMHLVACEHCQQAHDEFLRLQRELRAHEFQPDPFAKRRVLALSTSEPFWKRRIAVPIPLVATMLLVVFVLALWISFGRPQTSRLHTVRIATDEEAGTRETFDLSKFDHGERATITKVRKSETSQGQ